MNPLNLSMPKNPIARVLAALLGVLIATLVMTSFQGKPVEAATTCSGKQVYPGQDLSKIAAAAPAGTTFCVKDGSYSVVTPVVVQKGDKFIGVYSDSTRPLVKTTRAYHVFGTGGADYAQIKDLAVTGAVGNDSCEPNCGRGIGGGGANVVIENVWAYGNANQGVGAMGPGLVVRNSTLSNNGSASFTDLAGPRSAAGLKTINSFKVENSRITDNYWNGIWCDEQCDAMVLRGNTITGNGKTGVSYEISTGPSVIANNVIRGNGYKDTYSREAELLVAAASNIDIYGNTFGTTVNDGFLSYSDDRGDLSNVKFHDNTMNGDLTPGCGKVGVTCTNNR